MALYLEGKTPLDANDLSPKEATLKSTVLVLERYGHDCSFSPILLITSGR
jgi:hypothetical protein